MHYIVYRGFEPLVPEERSIGGGLLTLFGLGLIGAFAYFSAKISAEQERDHNRLLLDYYTALEPGSDVKRAVESLICPVFRFEQRGSLLWVLQPIRLDKTVYREFAPVHDGIYGVTDKNFINREYYSDIKRVSLSLDIR